MRACGSSRTSKAARGPGSRYTTDRRRSVAPWLLGMPRSATLGRGSWSGTGCRNSTRPRIEAAGIAEPAEKAAIVEPTEKAEDAIAEGAEEAELAEF